jgi:acetyl-CoA C-acetyltransferase
MESIKDKVAIVGMGCCKFGENWDKSAEDMMVDAAFEAYQDAGIEAKDIQACWFGTTRLSTAEPCATALKFDYIPVTRVENLCATATDALRNACLGIASGMYDICMAIGVEKLKDQGAGGLGGGGGGGGGGGNGTGEMGGGAAMFFARMASRYMYQYGYSYDDFKRVLAKIDVKNHHNGSLNPKAHFQREITEEMAINGQELP